MPSSAYIEINQKKQRFIDACICLNHLDILVINRHTRNRYWSKVDSILEGKRKLSLKRWIHVCLLIVLENTAYLLNFVKMFLCNQEENIQSVYE